MFQNCKNDENKVTKNSINVKSFIDAFAYKLTENRETFFH